MSGVEWDKDFLEWCEILERAPCAEYQAVFLSGKLWQALADDSGVLRARVKELEELLYTLKNDLLSPIHNIDEYTKSDVIELNASTHVARAEIERALDNGAGHIEDYL